MSLGSKPAIFLHIPKTAGTTLHTIVDRQYNLENIHSFGANAQASVQEFQNLSYEEREKIHLLRGHMAFGLHEYLPLTDDYFTILREPVRRVVSYYNFILRTPDHYLYEMITSKKMSLLDLMKTDVPIMMNDAQVRLVSGVWADVGYGEVTPAILEKAKHNLKNYFVVVGITEEFDKTLFLLREKLNWKGEVFYQKKNVTRHRANQLSSPETLAAIRQYNQMDDALYQFAKTLFWQEIKAQGIRFPLRVKLFQLQNFFNGKYREKPAFSLRYFLRSKIRPFGS